MSNLFHYSEEPNIERFVPHVPETNRDFDPHVWAIDAEHAPLYWFPRECPRATTWSRNPSEGEILRDLFGGVTRRIHWVEQVWVERIDAAVLWEYRFDPEPFRVIRRPDGEPLAPGYFVADVAVTPLEIRPLGSCRERQAAAGVDLRVVDNLWPIIDLIVASTLPFSIVRKHNALPRPA